MLKLFRNIKRSAVLAPGLILSYVAIVDIYPSVSKRFPAALAVFLTYVLTAYILIPGAIRLIRLVVKPRHIPLYCVTPDGFASDPVNIGIEGTRQQVINAMQKSGWFLADKRTPRTLLKMILSIVGGRPYPSAPFSTLYLFGRKQDFGFELPVSDDPSNRHHVRFWAIKYEDGEIHPHVQFWHKLHPDKNPYDDNYLWLGAASLDTGLNFIRHNAQITHMIHPDTDAERDLIVQSLEQAKVVKNTKSLRAGAPYSLGNRVWRGQLRADGFVKIVRLK